MLFSAYLRRPTFASPEKKCVFLMFINIYFGRECKGRLEHYLLLLLLLLISGSSPVANARSRFCLVWWIKRRKWQNETQSNYDYQNGNLLSFEILINRKKSCNEFSKKDKGEKRQRSKCYVFHGVCPLYCMRFFDFHLNTNTFLWIWIYLVIFSLDLFVRRLMFVAVWISLICITGGISRFLV